MDTITNDVKIEVIDPMHLNKAEAYLCYIVGTKEMGSEGRASFMYPCVAQGNDDKEIFQNYGKNVQKIYDVDITQDIKKVDNIWYCYYYLLQKSPIYCSCSGTPTNIGVTSYFIPNK